MEPRIQYATTADGVKIAYWEMGEGPAYVQMWGLFSHIQVEWEYSAWRDMFERLAKTRRLIKLNWRGSGLSQRDVGEFSLDAFVRDLEAVADYLRLDRFALHGDVDAGPVAVAYAACHPERVSHLMLSNTWARGPDPLLQSLRSLREADWEMYLQTQARHFLGWRADEQAERLDCILQRMRDAGDRGYCSLSDRAI